MTRLCSSALPAGLGAALAGSWRSPVVARVFRLLLAGALAVAAVGGRSIAAAQDLAAGGQEAGSSSKRKPGIASLEALRFPVGSRRGLLADGIWLHGVPARVLIFDTPLSTPELIRYLSAQQPALTDLNVLSGQAILSGRVGQERWVIQMEGLGARRTAGSISAVNLLASHGTPVPDWLPAGSRLRLDVAMMEDGVRFSESIWQYVLPPEQLAPLLEDRLIQSGWHRLPASDEEHWWTRGKTRMRLSLVPLEGGSGLLVSGRAP